jgi:ecotin
VAAGLLWVGLLPLTPLAMGPARAIPRLDLKPYPAPAPGERRWVIQLSGLLPPSQDPAISAHPADWRVELIAGRNLELDCNRVTFSGRMRSQPVAGTELRVVQISQVTPLASTRMACPPGELKRRAFVPMGGKPFVVPYDVSRPIVLYAPKDLELRWRLWKAERRQWPAQEF